MKGIERDSKGIWNILRDFMGFKAIKRNFKEFLRDFMEFKWILRHVMGF